MLNAVLFDLDNTLVDRDQAFHDCVRNRFSEPAVIAELLRLDHGGRGDRQTLFSYWQKQTGSAMTQTSFGRMLAQHIQPDLDLIKTLYELSSTFKLGVITNGSSETQRLKFYAAGLEQVITSDRLWVSEEVGKAKPDPAIFLLAINTLAEEPENCLHIGDNEMEDLKGALAAGLRARLVDAALNAAMLEELIHQELMK